ncbi:MAG: glycosyltransferase family 2 protein [Bacteroidales bacterium]|nr:glycosyltransferase family 2 protein [Bacteroidales bacterium]
MMEVLWWLLLGLILIPYLLYPSFMKWVYRKKYLIAKREESNNMPFVSLVMSVYNEENVLDEKLRSIFASDYPADKMEVLIGSDGSTDRTTEILTSWAKRDPHLRVFLFKERRGKISVINDLVRQAHGQIIISSDAKAMLFPDTISHLVRWFSDPSIGIVGGVLLNPIQVNAGIVRQEQFYMDNEMKLKYYEGLAGGYVMGVYGALFAIRKELFPEVPPYLMVDDFYITLRVIERGFRVIIDPEAKANQKLPLHLKEEFRRKDRIATGNFQNLRIFWRWILTPWKKASLFFICHKVLRWLVPFFLVAWFILTLLLSHQLFYRFFLAVFIFIIIIPILDWILNKFGIYVYVLRLITHFLTMNLALVTGCFRWMFERIDKAIWEPSKR